MSEINFPVFTGRSWSDETPKSWTFADERELEGFLSQVRETLKGTIDQYQYNSLPSFVAFYRQYKESGLTRLTDFYHHQYRTTFSTTHLSCVGLSFAFKNALTHKLSGTPLSQVCDYFYFASCCEFPNDCPPAVLEEGHPLCPAELTEHVSLVVKIRLGQRGGHIFMDLGYGLDVPVVVMEDGHPPQSGTFQTISRVGIRTHVFRHATKDFVLWTTREPTRESHRLFYLKRSFLRLDFPEKRHKLNPVQGAAAYKDGIPLAGYFAVLGNAADALTAFTINEGKFDSVKMPYQEVFVDGKASNDILEKSLKCIGGNAKEVLMEYIECCRDQQFVSQVVDMDTNFRKQLEEIWDDNNNIQPDYGGHQQ